MHCPSSQNQREPGRVLCHWFQVLTLPCSAMSNVTEPGRTRENTVSLISSPVLPCSATLLFEGRCLCYFVPVFIPAHHSTLSLRKDLWFNADRTRSVQSKAGGGRTTQCNREESIGYRYSACSGNESVYLTQWRNLFHCPSYLAKWRAVARDSPTATWSFVRPTRLRIPQNKHCPSFFFVFLLPNADMFTNKVIYYMVNSWASREAGEFSKHLPRVRFPKLQSPGSVSLMAHILWHLSFACVLIYYLFTLYYSFPLLQASILQVKKLKRNVIRIRALV